MYVPCSGWATGGLVEAIKDIPTSNLVWLHNPNNQGLPWFAAVVFAVLPVLMWLYGKVVQLVRIGVLRGRSPKREDETERRKEEREHYITRQLEIRHTSATQRSASSTDH